MRLEDKTYIKWFDKQCVLLEKDSDKAGYKIDEDIAYQETCEILTEIEWEITTPTTQDWIHLAWFLGQVRERVNNRIEMG